MGTFSGHEKRNKRSTFLDNQCVPKRVGVDVDEYTVSIFSHRGRDVEIVGCTCMIPQCK